MALNIKDEAVHEAVRQLATLTGESQAQAVATAVRERLARVEQDDLSERLRVIGRETARRIAPESRTRDHGELLYDDRGLPG
ncbi:type II toxin-antitoxin system VapB family antitoxin [Mycobacterium sp. 236(2023)]|uniref:type II toxin-antitoxin system VapB family antitoxin n=1 Tax=Mycobacterium sp. 236(2023) TaxID=3038163 RepID=UPI00241503BB|nr:type II toxin-antitoxin system VapB family antitoxin [Mycobacterium sp. 236(2023)]MDG4663751.1 type II toxin-antitoxin system VapB family antitoxin [Mycobacterium sp. 236(2023)]